MDCNFKQETKEEFFKIYNDKAKANAKSYSTRMSSEEPKIEFISKYAKSKKKWEINFNKTWKKLTVGQQIKIVIDVDGKDHASLMFHPTTHVSNLDDNGKKMFNDKGQPLKRTWKTIEKQGVAGIGTKRRYYDYMITKYNYPKLDRVVGAKLG